VPRRPGIQRFVPPGGAPRTPAQCTLPARRSRFLVLIGLAGGARSLTASAWSCGPTGCCSVWPDGCGFPM
ncbi:MAG: hypothetical protein, partial [Olavius algarvensis Gamma 1 endosymbiont]